MQVTKHIVCAKNSENKYVNIIVLAMLNIKKYDNMSYYKL